MSWATAGHLVLISQRAREATGWTWEEQERRDALLHTLTRKQFCRLDTHLERLDLSRVFRGFDHRQSESYERAVTREFRREFTRWQEMQRWIRANVEVTDASRDPQS